MTLTDIQRDILIKAAEGIQEGLWCVGDAFEDHSGVWGVRDVLVGRVSLERSAQAHRCAVGELALRTFQLGGNDEDYVAVIDAISSSFDHWHPGGSSVVSHNDVCMENLTIFEGGQEWSRIFREAADA